MGFLTIQLFSTVFICFFGSLLSHTTQLSLKLKKAFLVSKIPCIFHLVYSRFQPSHTFQMMPCCFSHLESVSSSRTKQFQIFPLALTFAILHLSPTILVILQPSLVFSHSQQIILFNIYPFLLSSDFSSLPSSDSLCSIFLIKDKTIRRRSAETQTYSPLEFR